MELKHQTSSKWTISLNFCKGLFRFGSLCNATGREMIACTNQCNKMEVMKTIHFSRLLIRCCCSPLLVNQKSSYAWRHFIDKNFHYFTNNSHGFVNKYHPKTIIFKLSPCRLAWWPCTPHGTLCECVIFAPNGVISRQKWKIIFLINAAK